MTLIAPTVNRIVATSRRVRHVETAAVDAYRSPTKRRDEKRKALIRR